MADNTGTTPVESVVDKQDYAVELGGIRKSFGGHEVLVGVSLRVRPGEVCSIIGLFQQVYTAQQCALACATRPDDRTHLSRPHP